MLNIYTLEGSPNMGIIFKALVIAESEEVALQMVGGQMVEPKCELIGQALPRAKPKVAITVYNHLLGG